MVRVVFNEFRYTFRVNTVMFMSFKEIRRRERKRERERTRALFSINRKQFYEDIIDRPR